MSSSVIDLVNLRLAAALVHAVPGATCRLQLDDGTTLSAVGDLTASQLRHAVASVARRSQVHAEDEWLHRVVDVRLSGTDACPPALHRFWWDDTPVWCFATTMRPSTTRRELADAIEHLDGMTRGGLHVDDLQLVPDGLLGVTIVCCLDDEVAGCARSAMEHLAGTCVVAELTTSVG